MWGCSRGEGRIYITLRAHSEAGTASGGGGGGCSVARFTDYGSVTGVPFLHHATVCVMQYSHITVYTSTYRGWHVMIRGTWYIQLGKYLE